MVQGEVQGRLSLRRSSTIDKVPNFFAVRSSTAGTHTHTYTNATTEARVLAWQLQVGTPVSVVRYHLVPVAGRPARATGSGQIILPLSGTGMIPLPLAVVRAARR